MLFDVPNDSSPNTGFLRLSEVLRRYPVSRSTWWAGVKAGRYPRPVRLSERTTAWPADEIQALIERTAQQREGGAS